MSQAVAVPRTVAGMRVRFSGMARAWQVVASFCGVFAVYWIYWLIAVPLIEPNIEAEVVTHPTEQQIDDARNAVNNRQQNVAQFFAEGAWELDKPSVWQNDQTRLLFKTLTTRPDGTVELRPCTVLLFPKGAPIEGPSAPHPIILRAPAGANVRFDQPIEFKNVDLTKRKLLGGNLLDQITIYRKAREGADDELEILTRDVEMQGERIFTPHPVQFRLGRNHGSGRDMEILMNAAEGAPTGGFKTGTIRSLELKRDVHMQLHTSGGPLAGGAAGGRRGEPELPMEITCQGSFLYEIVRNAASFHDAVNVFRPNPLGESDQLNCEVLTDFFESGGAPPPEPPNAAAAASPTQPSGFRMRRIEARGDPVVVRSPSRGIYVHCRGIDYSPGVDGAMGSLVALGPGVLQGTLPKENPGSYDAKWSREFRFEPAEGNQHRASMIGSAVVRFPQLGTIQADEIFAWLTQKLPPSGALPPPAPPPAAEGAPPVPQAPGDAAPSGWQLERLLARVHQDPMSKTQARVIVDSPQLHAVTGQLEAWVDRPPATAALVGATPPAGTGSASAVAQPAAQQPAAGGKKRPQQNSTQKFDLSGGIIRLQLVPEGEQMALSMVTVEDRARLHEISPTRAGEKPLVVEGDRIHVAQANTPATRVTVNGRPGRLEAGGMTLRGAAIEMNKATNRLWIDSKGTMTMPIEQDLDGKAIASPTLMEIVWQGRMDFQGNSVVFERKVVVSTASQVLQTEKMEVVLDRPIDFANPNPNRGPGGKAEDKPQIAFVRCFGHALLSSRQVDERGKQTSVDELSVFELRLNKATGDVTGLGPGSLTHVGLGSDASPRGGGAPDRQRPPKADGADDELRYLNVQFRSFLDGNLNQRVSRFGEPTKAVYGPVSDWKAKLNPDEPTSLGPQGLVLDSQELVVREMPSRERRDRGWVELTAKGNVVGEGAQFTARGAKLTYSEEKDQLVLHGDGFSPAEFFQDNPADGTRRASKADELTYWFTLQRVQVSGVQSFDMQVPNTKKPSTKPKKKLPF